MKAMINIFGQKKEVIVTNKTEAIAWLMNQAGLKTSSGWAYCLRQYNYVNFPRNIGCGKIIEG